MYISIKNHIILLLIFFTLMPILLLKIVAYPRIHSDLEDVIMDNLEVIGHKQAELVSTWMRERMKDVLVIAANPFMSKSANITKRMRIITILSNIWRGLYLSMVIRVHL